MGCPWCGPVLQSSGHRGAVDERGFFGEKETYFQVQIHPFFRPAQSFKMNQSLKTMEVLLCSAFMMAEERQGFIKHWIWRNTLVGLAISSPSFPLKWRRWAMLSRRA